MLRNERRHGIDTREEGYIKNEAICLSSVFFFFFLAYLILFLLSQAVTVLFNYFNDSSSLNGMKFNYFLRPLAKAAGNRTRGGRGVSSFLAS